MANPFTSLVSNLNNIGFFDFILPFIFTFAVLWGLLAKTKVLGDNQRVNGVVSMVVAFFIIGFGGPALGAFFTTLFGYAVIILATILVIMLFLGMGGYDLGKVLDPKVGGIILVGIAIILFFIAAGALGVRVGSGVFEIIFVLIVLAVAIGFIAK